MAGDGWYRPPPPGTRVTIVGRTGSGKSTALKALFAEQYPRVVVLDHLGTQWPMWERCEVVYTYAEALTRLRKWAPKETRWRLVCCFAQESEDVTRLFQLLAPDPRQGGGFPRAVGGVALLNDELSQVAHVSCGPLIRQAWSAGRHVGLTVLGASQRISQVARIVTASTEWLGVCQQHEPLDMEVVAQYLPPEGLAAVEALPPFGLVLYNTGTGRGMILHSTGPGKYQVAAQLGGADAPKLRGSKKKPA
jgi:hypothetical protein